jgi:hypothetical protein
MPRWAVRYHASDIPDKNRGQASFDPSHIPNDHEEAGGADGDKGTGHSDPHRNSNDSKAHAGGLTLSVKRFNFPEPGGSISAADIWYLSATWPAIGLSYVRSLTRGF